MKRIRDVGLCSLDWRVAKGIYELRAGEDHLATLRWQKGVSLYRGEAAEGSWTFKRTGIFSTKVTVRAEHSSKDLFTLRLSGTPESVKLSDGRECHWAADHDGLLLKNASGDSLIQVNTQGTIENLTGDVKFTADIIALPEVSLLILFGWYVVVLKAKAAAEAMATADIYPIIMMGMYTE